MTRGRPGEQYVQEMRDRPSWRSSNKREKGSDGPGRTWVRTVVQTVITGTEGVGQSGDCFVVVNDRGECWSGHRWVALWRDGLQFRRPEPAYELCDETAREAERLSGVAGAVCYIPPGTPGTLALAPFPDLSRVDLRTLALTPKVS